MEDLKKLYPNSFDRLGSLKGAYNIRVDPTVKPAIHARRKVPIESKEAIDKELDYLIEEEIITEQVEPTPWVSSVTFQRKPNGEVRVCLDPSNLNKAIIREHHKPMTVEEIAHELAGATVYMKADALKAFLQIHLTHEASLLTTFNSHRGRLRFLWMPFGAKMSQDVFQLRMDAILEQCPGVIGIHDDMVIFGVDQQDHDANLINLLNVCQKEGLVLNSKKLELRRERVTFFGAEYSTQGMHPDPKKVQGITEMTTPMDKQQLQSFLGMVNYMGTFIPNLSHHTELLRAMLKKDNVFHWEEQQTRSFQQVKTLIAKANTTPLRYYDRNLSVTVQADTSLRGLGACLIQQHKGKDQPIAFASKSLTDVETRYANIERELLAIIFACQHFSTYLLGRSFVAESDHKPFEMIAMKNLANAPPRLQRMLLELQRYDVTIKCRPGKEMQLVNALSCCPARASQEIKLDMRVDYIAFMKPWIEKLKDSTQRDPILATVYQLTQQGWPHQRRHVPRLARRYWDFRDKLSTDDGMLLKGPRLIIPGELQEEYLSHLHEGHLSASKIQENAKQHMYWTGIDADIEDYTKRCQECIKRSQVAKEPLQPHDIPEGPWRKLGMDYFAFDGNSYVLICDYFLKFPFLYRARRDTSARNGREFKLNVTDPDLLIPIKQTRVTTRHSDLREPQPSSSDSQPASSQPVSETTTSKSSVSLPSSPSGNSSTESTSTSGTDSSSSETSSESSSQPSLNASSPETSSSASTSRSTSPELLEMERSFNSLLVGTRDRQGHPVMRSQMDNLRDQQQRIAVLKQVASQLQNQPQPVSAPPVANMRLPSYPRRRPSDKGSKKQVQAENANAPRKSSDSETDRLQDIQEEPCRCIGPSRVKELAKFFMPTSDEEENSRVNNRTRCKKLFEPKKEEESKK